MSMLSEFLNEHAISAKDLVEASQQLENSTIAERELRVKRNDARREKKAYADLGLEKPKSLGRGLSASVVNRAIAGTPVPRLVRKKITRAINVRLALAKKDAVEWRPLFGDVPSKKGKSTKKK